MAKKSSGTGRAGSPLPAAGSQPDDGAHGVTRPTTGMKSSALIDNHVIYCGDNVEQLKNPPAIPADSPLPALKQKMARIPLSQLTEVTIRGRTKSGDTPLHRAAKTGKFDEIPRHLLQLELFMAKNNREETPLHFAAKHGCLNRVPSEFLTNETLTALDYYGRTPLHVAADYGHADQIPLEILTPDVLKLPTKNFSSKTILHIVAGRNEINKIPGNFITPEMWNVKNGYGSTPLETLNDILPTQSQLTNLHEKEITFDKARLTREMASQLIDSVPTERQLTNLREMGIAFDKGRLTRKMVAQLIEAEREKRRQATRMSLSHVAGCPPDTGIVVCPPAKITLLARSSSGSNPYKVEFMADGSSVRVYCHCQAGAKRWMCKHKLALILGDSNMLFDSRQNELLSRIQSWPQYIDLKTRTDEFQNKLRDIEEAIIAEHSKFSAWLETRSQDNQTNADEETPFIQIYIRSVDDDPEVQGKLEEMDEAKAELKRKEKTIKEDFMLGLTMGFHRVGKSAV